MADRPLSVSEVTQAIKQSMLALLFGAYTGKDKTALQMVAILMLIVHQTYTVYFGFYETEFDFAGVGLILLYISLGLALFSGGEYFKIFVDAVDAKEERLTQVSS